MITSISRWSAFAAVALIALALRTWDLGARPMHADEANQAVKTGELIAGTGYHFDPRDHHGPTLYFAAVPLAWVRGEHSLASLRETTLRLVPALFGTASVLLLALVRWRDPRNDVDGDAGASDDLAAVLAATFLALSPPTVYYARYFIQETLLVTFTLLAFMAAQRWWVSGTKGWAVLTGAGVGLMVATKETALVFVAAATVAALVARVPRPTASFPGRHAALAAAVAVATAALLYSSFGTNLSGLRDAVLAPMAGLQRATGPTGHEKPWWYYLRLLTWQRSGGLVWEQAVFTGLALIGAAVAFRSRSVLLRGAAVYAGIILLVLSVVPYKTPWNVIHAIPPLAVLAAGALVAIGRLRTGWLVAAAFSVVVGVSLATQTRLVAFRRSADQRNPYAYVHSSPDVKKYRALAEAALAARPDQPVRVISEEYWPLPWYLRGLPRVGYWTTPPENCDGALVISSADLAPAVRERLHGAYRQSFLGLRPGFVCIVFTPEERP